MTITQDPNVYLGMFIDPEFEQYVEMLRTQQPRKFVELLERVIPVVETNLLDAPQLEYIDVLTKLNSQYTNVLTKLNSLNVGS